MRYRKRPACRVQERHILNQQILNESKAKPTNTTNEEMQILILLFFTLYIVDSCDVAENRAADRRNTQETSAIEQVARIVREHRITSN